MGNRADDVLKNLEAPIIVPHVQQKFPYEALFRSEQFALTENATREFGFLVEFFFDDSTELFNSVFGRALVVVSKGVDQRVQESYDSISLFLCLQIAKRFRLKSPKALDKYWDGVIGALKQRLGLLLKMNVQSVRDCDVSRIKTVDQRPHYITRRYAEFVAGFLGVINKTENEEDNDFVRSLLSDLQQEVERFVLKLASRAFSKNRKEQLIFLINNYDLVLSVIVLQAESSREADSFKDLLATRSSEYVEQVLFPHFGALIRFIQSAELLVQKSPSSDFSQSSEFRSLSALIAEFNAGWKSALDAINKEVLGSFPNFKNGTNILQQALTAFVQYYHRLHKVLSYPAFSAHPDRSKLISVHQLMVEVKKYKPNF